MTRPRRLAIAAPLALVVLAGCLGGAPSDGSQAPNPTTSSGEVLVVTKANGTRAARQPAETRADFRNLSADRQDEFLAALEDDVRNPSQWGPGTDVEYVRYDGTWYWVTVVIEN